MQPLRRSSKFRPLRTLVGLAAASMTTAFAAESTGSLDALKKLSLEELMSIEVTSVSRYPEPLSETPSAIQVITNRQIRRSGASSIPQALRLAHNLNVAQKNAHDWGISARGFNTELSNKLLVLIDGRTVYTPLYSGVFWDVQDYLLEDIARIEVISGPGGTLWGANAVNGVINISTKLAQETAGLYVEGGAGSNFRGFAGARYGGSLAPNVHYRVYAKHFDRDSETFANGGDPHDEWHKSQAGFRIDAEPNSDDTFTFQGDVYSGREGVVSSGDAEVAGGNVLGRWSRVFANGSDMRLQMYYDRTHLRLPVPPDNLGLAPAGFLTDDLDTYDLDFQHRLHPHERHHLIWGGGYRFMSNHVDNAPALGLLPPDLTRTLVSAFVQDDMDVTDNLVFTLGTKVEHNDYTGFEFEPTVRLQWRLAPNKTLWAAVSRAVRTPSRLDRHVSQPTGPIVVLQGGRDFESERVVAWEAGYRTQIGRRASVSVSTFYNEYSKLRSLSFTETTVIPLYFENNLEGETYGVELALSVQPVDGWQVHAGYNLLKEDLRVAPGRYDFSNALNETADPEHQFSVRSSVDLPGNLEFDANFRWVDALTINNTGAPATVSSYAELDLRLGWHVNQNVEFSIVGQNLLNDHHPEYFLPSPTRVEIRRSVYAKLVWRY